MWISSCILFKSITYTMYIFFIKSSLKGYKFSVRFFIPNYSQLRNSLLTDSTTSNIRFFKPLISCYFNNTLINNLEFAHK